MKNHSVIHIPDSSGELEKYLYRRGFDLVERQKLVEITEDNEQLASVAGTWKSSKDDIKLVVRARLDVLRRHLLFSSLPQETPVIRQCMAEVAGILEDFEILHGEFEQRKKQKPEKEN